MRTVEKALCLLSVIGYLFTLLSWKGGAPLTTLSLFTMTVIYLLFSFALLNGVPLRAAFSRASYAGIPGRHVVGSILSGVVFASVCLSLMFETAYWQGHHIVLLMAIPGLLIVVVTGIIFAGRSQSGYYKRLLTRAVPMLVICIFLFFVSPRHIVLHMRYKDHPDYIRATERYWENRRDEAAAHDLEQEERKLKQP